MLRVFEDTMSKAAKAPGTMLGLGGLKRRLCIGGHGERLDVLARGRRASAHLDVALPEAIDDALASRALEWPSDGGDGEETPEVSGRIAEDELH